jgi:hypothetical protein
VDRLVTTRDGRLVNHDIRYFVTSLDPDRVTPTQLLSHVRNHWRIENCLHFLKDRWWDEDRHWCRRPGLGTRLAMLTSAALDVLRLLAAQLSPLGRRHQPLSRRADWLGENPRLALQALGFAPL